MYLKTQTVKKANGKSYTYYRLAESYRENGKVKHRILAELGALKSEEVEYLARRFAGIAGIELGALYRSHELTHLCSAKWTLPAHGRS